MASVPFHSALSLVRFTAEWLEQGCEVELTNRAFCALIRHHTTQIQSSPTARQGLMCAQPIVHQTTGALKDRYRVNLAALKLISHEMKQNWPCDKNSFATSWSPILDSWKRRSRVNEEPACSVQSRQSQSSIWELALCACCNTFIRHFFT